jgi:hypothetical protein
VRMVWQSGEMTEMGKAGRRARFGFGHGEAFAGEGALADRVS